MEVRELQILIGARLRELRGARGLSQQKLAELAHVSADFISQAERGRRAPSIFVLTKLSNVLGVHPAEFISPPTGADQESDAARDLRLLLSGRPDRELRLIWRLASVVLAEHGEDETTPAARRTGGARRKR